MTLDELKEIIASDDGEKAHGDEDEQRDVKVVHGNAYDQHGQGEEHLEHGVPVPDSRDIRVVVDGENAAVVVVPELVFMLVIMVMVGVLLHGGSPQGAHPPDQDSHSQGHYERHDKISQLQG